MNVLKHYLKYFSYHRAKKLITDSNYRHIVYNDLASKIDIAIRKKLKLPERDKILYPKYLKKRETVFSNLDFKQKVELLLSLVKCNVMGKYALFSKVGKGFIHPTAKRIVLY